jgi:regulator of protease activity HflC (stomatin/prohibitin superfamily)
MLFLLPFIIALVALSVRIVQQYENSIVFTLGRFSRTLMPGLNFIIPILEWTRTVDMRVLTRDIPKQQVITKDNVPVTINGVVYFRVLKVETAILVVQDYNYAIAQYSQAALRDVIGGMTFDELLAERQLIGEEIEKIVAKESAHWGLEVTTIKIQDVDVPEELKKMMSRQASAEREKRATITKAEGDKMAAMNLADAARTMYASPGAMQLRTLQTIDGLGPTASNTVVLAVPVELMELVKNVSDKFSEKKS